MDGPVGFQTMSSELPNAINYHRWILRLIRPHLRGETLEIGCGYGQYTTQLAPHVRRLLAVDCARACLDQLAGGPANVQTGLADLTAPDFTEQVGRAAFDVAICLNVLEHIADDVDALDRLFQALRPGGRLLLLVPAHQRLYGPMDALAGHHRRYSRQRLRWRLQAAGFDVRQLRYFNPLGGLGWWINARLMKPATLSDPGVNRQILWYDRYVQPLSRLLDPLTRRFFGQSLWAVAERPSVRAAA
jgi:SAM-dependent methyltransferase